MLQSVIETPDAIPEGMAEHYEEQDGRFVLKVDGHVPKTRVDEFRNNNIKLMKQNEELQSKVSQYDDFDLEQAREALRFKEDVEKQNLMDKGQYEELLKKEIAQLEKQHGKQILQLQENVENAQKELSNKQRLLNQNVIDRGVQETLDNKPMLTTTARMLLMDRAKSMFTVDNTGKIIATDDDNNVRYAKNGVDLYGISDYIEDYILDYQNDPSFVKPSTGGGARSAEEFQTGSGGAIRLSEAEAKNLSVYKRAKEESERTGRQLVIEK